MPAFKFARQKLEEFAEIRFVEFLGRRELPEYGAEAVAEFEHAGIVKPLHGIAGLRQHAAVGGKARAFQREHKAVGHLARPLAKTLRLLRAVIGAVDLDRGEFRSRVLQLFGLDEFFRVKHPAPGLKRPAADSDEDTAGFRSDGFGSGGFAHWRVSFACGKGIRVKRNQSGRNWPDQVTRSTPCKTPDRPYLAH